MRRKDREITSPDTIDDFIRSENTIRVGFFDNGEIYIVPLNYGYERCGEKQFFYFHGAKAGRKYQLALSSPSVGFEIDGRFKVLEGDTACNYSANFQSVIGTGTLSLIDDTSEKEAALKCLMKQLTGRNDFTFSGERLNGTAVFRLEVSTMTCKARNLP